MARLNIVYRSPSDLVPRERNPRTHSDHQIKQLMRSIEHFWFINPVLVDDTGGLIAGHGSIEAATRLDLETVPPICVADISEAETRFRVSSASESNNLKVEGSSPVSFTETNRWCL